MRCYLECYDRSEIGANGLITLRRTNKRDADIEARKCCAGTHPQRMKAQKLAAGNVQFAQ